MNKNDEFWNSMCVIVAILSIAALLTIGAYTKSKEYQKKNSVCFNLANDDYMQHVSYSQKPEYERCITPYIERRNGIYVRCFKETLTCNGSITQTQIINVFPNTIEHRENAKSFCTQCNGTDLKNDSIYTSDINDKPELEHNLEPIEKEIKRLSLLRSKILKERYENLNRKYEEQRK